jgi:hypothetical protein
MSAYVLAHLCEVHEYLSAFAAVALDLGKTSKTECWKK